MHCISIGQCGNSVYMPAKRPKRELKRPPLRRMSGEELRKWRIEHDLSQEELAYLLGINQKTISLWELGKRKPPVYLPLLLEYLEKLGYLPDNLQL